MKDWQGEICVVPSISARPERTKVGHRAPCLRHTNSRVEHDQSRSGRAGVCPSSAAHARNCVGDPSDELNNLERRKLFRLRAMAVLVRRPRSAVESRQSDREKSSKRGNGRTSSVGPPVRTHTRVGDGDQEQISSQTGTSDLTPEHGV